MTTRVVTAHIPDALAKKLDGIASRMDRPRGWIVKEAIEGYLALDEERHRQTLAAIAEVDAGKAIDHVDVKAWATSVVAPPHKARRR